MQAYVGGFLFSEDRKHVALIEKLRPKWQAGKLNAIGGKVETKEENGVVTHIETPLEAMVREFQEETGVFVPQDQWKYRAHLVIPEVAEVFFFAAFSDVIGDVKTVEEEKVNIYRVDDVIFGVNRSTFDKEKPIIENLKWLIPLCMDKAVQGPVEVIEEVATTKTA